MRILLLNLYYPPDTSATAKMAETVAEALARSHEVTVLCGRPSYDPAWRLPWRLYQTVRQGTVRVVRAGSSAFPRREMKKRIFNYLSYVLLAVPRALVLPADVVVAMTDPPFEGIVGAAVARLKRKPYVYNIRDLYPDMAVGGSILRPGLLVRVWERLHRWALGRASSVVVLGEDMRQRILGKGVEAARVVVVRDGTDLGGETAAAATRDEAVIQSIRGGFERVILHAGNLGFYGAWETLLEGARILAEDGIQLVFVGDGAERERLEAAARNLSNVRFLPFFPSAKIPSVLAAPDAHLVTIKRGLEGVVVPSKIYSILAAGKPILAVAPAESDVVRIGESKGFSTGADPDDPREFARRARELFADPERLSRMRAAARAAAPEFDRPQELNKLLSVVEQAAQS